MIGALIAPALAGVIAGVLIGISEGAYWAFAVIAELGAFLAGFEHPDGWEAADRGIVGGALYGLFLLLTHWVLANHPRASLGSLPPLLIIVTAIAGALGAALGGRLGRFQRTGAAGAETHSNH